MNQSLRHLFNAVIALFVVLAISTTTIMTFASNSLNSDSRNIRALYHEFGAPRGLIVASDGTVLARSDPSNDAFSYQRVYPNGATYAPITGFFSIAQRADRGIEASRNSLLSGENDSLWLSKLKATFTGEANQGATIETSIDAKLQTLAMQLLGDGGYNGAIVAMEPSTGRILAMASTPSYDPNTLAKHSTKEASQAYRQLATADGNPMLNHAANELYSPGSTFKIITAAAALESGKYHTDSVVPAGATFTLPGTQTQITNSSVAANGTNGSMTLQQAFVTSSNTAFAQIGIALGADAMSKQAQQLGFGSTIVIDGSPTSNSAIEATASKFPSNAAPDRLGLASFGQGDVTETPLLNAMITSAVANGGTMMQPTLVDRVRASDLSVISQTSPSVFSHPFSEQTAQSLNQMMQAMIKEETPQLQIAGISVAGKTGTAQIGDGSSNDAWITGFAPADNPKIVVSVMVHDVTSYGFQVAGPMMQRIMQEALKQ